MGDRAVALGAPLYLKSGILRSKRREIDIVRLGNAEEAKLLLKAPEFSKVRIVGYGDLAESFSRDIYLAAFTAQETALRKQKTISVEMAGMR